MGTLRTWLVADGDTWRAGLAPSLPPLDASLRNRYLGLDRQQLLTMWNELGNRAYNLGDTVAEENFIDLITQANYLYAQAPGTPDVDPGRFRNFAEFMENYLYDVNMQVRAVPSTLRDELQYLMEYAVVPPYQAEEDPLLLEYLLFFELALEIMEASDTEWRDNGVYTEALLTSEHRAWLAQVWAWLGALITAGRLA